MKTLRIGLIIVCLAVLYGCSSPQLITEYQTVKIKPPALLMADCSGPEPLPSPATNLDLLNYAINLRLALDACNQDKARLREFYAEKP